MDDADMKEIAGCFEKAGKEREALEAEIQRNLRDSSRLNTLPTSAVKSCNDGDVAPNNRDLTDS